MIALDMLEKERSHAKNAVEEYVYYFKHQLDGPYQTYLSSEEQDKFSELLTKTENWLYDEGDDQDKKVYLDKLEQIQKVGMPVQERYQEAEWRPKLFEELKTKIEMYTRVAEDYKNKDENYMHIDAVDMEMVSRCVQDTQEWMTTASSAQDRLRPDEDPAVHGSQIREKLQELANACELVVTKPRPRVESPPAEEPAPTAGTEHCKKANGVAMEKETGLRNSESSPSCVEVD